VIHAKKVLLTRPQISRESERFIINSNFKAKNHNVRALLISMPWFDYQVPSIQIGSLSAYAHNHGFDVDCRHLHLETAALFGPDNYRNITCYTYKYFQIAELFFLALLFRDRTKRILKCLSSSIPNAKYYLNRLSVVCEHIFNNIDWTDYDLVGFTINSQQLFSSLLFATWIKRDYPHIRVLFGGPSVIGDKGISVLQCFSQVDWCMDGEGEIGFVELLKGLSSHNENIVCNVPSLIYRNGNNIYKNERKQLERLDELPDPAYDQYFSVLCRHPALKNSGVMPTLPIESSRGCIYRCAFCSHTAYWKGLRRRKPDEVAWQMRRMADRYVVNRFQFVDSILLAGSNNRLFSSIERLKGNYRIFCEIRADVSKEELVRMKRAGVSEIQVGIEAMSSGALKKMDKGTRVIDNLQIMKNCQEVGINHYSNIIMGFPTETQQDVNDAISNIKYAVTYRPLTPIHYNFYYDSPIYKKAKKCVINKQLNAVPFNYLLPKDINKKLIMTNRGYKLCAKKPDYRYLKRAVEIWCRAYNASLLENINFLRYYDCSTFLRIEDYRKIKNNIVKFEENGTTIITLNRERRELYLFCDAYKSFNEIKNRFPKWDPREIKKVLNKLVKLKVMFREDDDYLSLAIRANGAK